MSVTTTRVMRKPPDWMGQTHERILEYLAEHEVGQPAVIAEEIDTHPDYVSNLAGRLADAGLVRRLGRGVYQLSAEGEAFLAGELDASEYPPPDA